MLTDALTASTLGEDKRFVLTSLETTPVRGFGDIQPFLLEPGEGKGLTLD